MAMERRLVLLLIFLCCYLCPRFADAYDPVDPLGNITIIWDFLNIDTTSTIMVSIHNYQLYRHIEQPGWRLGWTWAGHEIIGDVTGAETTEQGNCSGVHFVDPAKPPHCCDRRPVMVDLQPGTPPDKQVANCCRGGVLSSLTQSNSTATAAFQINATQVPATRSMVDKLRHVQALLTWQITCSYSQFRDGPSPSCCVSLSSFYNNTIVGEDDDEQSSKIQALRDDGGDPPVVPVLRCTEHMCPIRVHWHVKQNYREYWRVKASISNYDVVSNYSDWNLVVRHPNLGNITQLFSFNYQPLIQYGAAINDTAMFWGMLNYNEMLLQDGNVQSEMILKKDPSEFTFSGGWAFPRRVYFDGHQCAMPSPDHYPSLPNAAARDVHRWLLTASCLLLLSSMSHVL
uniref:Uncharacterized protein n=1 Tax=Avena sativa TaxID=4498 RepID=A0ACD5XH93_AVESA